MLSSRIISITIRFLGALPGSMVFLSMHGRSSALSIPGVKNSSDSNVNCVPIVLFYIRRNDPAQKAEPNGGLKD